MWTDSHSSSTSPFTKNNNSSNDMLQQLPKTMEDVWRDISSGGGIIEPVSAAGRIILQDFFSRDPHPPSASAVRSTPPTPPPVMLTLRSSFVEETGAIMNRHSHRHQHSNNKRLITSTLPDSDSNRRHKRMIMNRESAARSRARKQAYTNELELEVAHLVEENARLKKQQQQLLRPLNIPRSTSTLLTEH